MFLGLEMGGTKLQLVAGSARGEITRRWRHSVDREAGASGIREQITKWLPEAVAEWDPRAVGIGFGGPVDWRGGCIARSHQISGWSGVPLAEWAVDNDANVAALGEAHCGNGRGAGTVFYITLGSGVGGGLVVDGRIYHGARPGESEIGHLRLDKSGTLVEERCSGWAVDRRVREAIALHPGSPLALSAGEARSGEARFLAAALEEGDAVAKAILSELADNLVMHPERVVIGGGLALMGEPLRSAVAEAMKAYLMEAFHPGPAVFLAGLREDAVPVGALLLAAEAARS
jgi:glucokinase